jgi:hypothetical protein
MDWDTNYLHETYFKRGVEQTIRITNKCYEREQVYFSKPNSIKHTFCSCVAVAERFHNAAPNYTSTIIIITPHVKSKIKAIRFVTVVVSNGTTAATSTSPRGHLADALHLCPTHPETFGDHKEIRIAA